MKNNKIIEHLIKNINFKNININLIKKNSKMLVRMYNDIKNIWDGLNIQINLTNSNLNSPINIILKKCGLNEYKIFKDFVDNADKVAFFSYENVNFFYIYNDEVLFTKDIGIIKKLIKQTITLKKYFKFNEQQIVVIWLPINASRDFSYDSITTNNLYK